MAKVKLNPILERVRGTVGDLVFKRYEDEVVITRKPDFEGVAPTAAQQALPRNSRRETSGADFLLMGGGR